MLTITDMDKSDIEIIKSFGGTGATARLCGVTSQAVSQWKKNGIPRPWRRFLEERAKVRASSSRGAA